MRLVVSIIFFMCVFQSINAQSDLQKSVNSAAAAIARNHPYNNSYVAKPQWQEKYESHMVAGNTLMNRNEYAKAIKSFNKALSIVPNSQEAKIARNYCRKMLKEEKR